MSNLMDCGAEFLKKMAKAKPELERIFEENNCSVENQLRVLERLYLASTMSYVRNTMCKM